MARTTAGPTSEVRREQILDAAMRVYAEKGYAEATNKDIAHEAGVTAPLLYYYFQTKRDLFDALLSERVKIGDAVSLLKADVADDLPPRVVLNQFVLDILNRMQTNHDSPAFRAMMQEAFHDPIVRGLFVQKMRVTQDMLADYLTRMAARGLVRPLDPSVASLIVLHSVAGFAMHHDEFNTWPSAERFVDTIVDMLVDDEQAVDTQPPGS